jgi:hypothetical protein
MSQAVAQVVEGLKASMTDGSTISINGRQVRLIEVSDNKARLELGWRVSLSTTIHLKVEPPGGEPIVMKSRVVSARVAGVKDGTITYSAEVMVESLAASGAPGSSRVPASRGAAAASAPVAPAPKPAQPAFAAPSQPAADASKDHTLRGPDTQRGLDAALAKRALQEEMTEVRGELTAERERRQRSEEAFQELERREAERASVQEEFKRQWEIERTALSTELQAAQAKAAELHVALERERFQRRQDREGVRQEWEQERATLAAELEEAKEAVADLQAALAIEWKRAHDREGVQQ